jgi:cephalosporin hydroxylase
MKQHVLQELRLYGSLVTDGSYVFVADGIMRDLAGAPRTTPEWAWDNPDSAIDEFLAENDGFVREDPTPVFDESLVRAGPTYSPRGWLRRVK